MHLVFEENNPEVTDQLHQPISFDLHTLFFKHLGDEVDARSQFEEMTGVAVRCESIVLLFLDF